MTDKLIINARQHLPWHQRLFCDAGTAMLWGFWLYLWRPILSTLSYLSTWGIGFRPMMASAVNVEGTVVALLGTSGTLLLWNLLPERHLPDNHRQPAGLPDYAAHFALPEQDIARGQDSQVVVVHHDEQGRIVRLAPRD